MVLVGDAKGKIAVLIDDMADTCGTIVQVQNVVKILEIIPQFFFWEAELNKNVQPE